MHLLQYTLSNLNVSKRHSLWTRTQESPRTSSNNKLTITIKSTCYSLGTFGEFGRRLGHKPVFVPTFNLLLHIEFLY